MELFQCPDNKFFIIKYKLKNYVEHCLQNNVIFLKKNSEVSLRKAILESHEVGIFLSCIDAKAFHAFGLVKSEPTEFIYLDHDQQTNLTQIKDQYQQYVRVDWKQQGVLSFDRTANIKNELNENKPINHCRDVQELKSNTAQQLHTLFQDAKPLKLPNTNISLQFATAILNNPLLLTQFDDHAKKKSRSRSREKLKNKSKDRKSSKEKTRKSSKDKKTIRKSRDRKSKDQKERKSDKRKSKDRRSKDRKSKDKKSPHRDHKSKDRKSKERKSDRDHQKSKKEPTKTTDEQDIYLREKEQREQRERDREKQLREQREQKEAQEKLLREQKEKEERERKEKERLEQIQKDKERELEKQRLEKERQRQREKEREKEKERERAREREKRREREERERREKDKKKNGKRKSSPEKRKSSPDKRKSSPEKKKRKDRKSRSKEKIVTKTNPTIKEVEYYESAADLSESEEGQVPALKPIEEPEQPQTPVQSLQAQSTSSIEPAVKIIVIRSQEDEVKPPLTQLTIKKDGKESTFFIGSKNEQIAINEKLADRLIVKKNN